MTFHDEPPSVPSSTIPAAPLRLLFAGGDAAIADAIAHALGARIEVRAVTSLEAAIAAVAGTGVDAALVQPRLAQGSGNALLGLLKREHPRVIRCLLLDDGRDAPGLAALENLHRLLCQPLDAGQLIDGLEAVIDLRRRLASPELAEAIGRVGRLPPPPALSLELMRRTENLEISAREIASLVEGDPTLAAKVLRLCNSAMYSGGRRIDDIHSAVVWLGNLTLRRLVLAGEVFGTPRMSTGQVGDERFREQSLAASRLAARLLPGPRADLAATAALLAGVGRLLPGVRTSSGGAGEPSAGLAYPEAGAYLLGLWGLSDNLVEAAALHLTPALAAEPGLGLVGACHVAWALVGEVPLDLAWVETQGLGPERAAWEALAASLRDG